MNLWSDRKFPIDGLRLCSRQVHLDERGAFFESFRKGDFDGEVFLQDNFSTSSTNVLRGLHYQFRNPQAQLVTVLKGRLVDVVVDVRLGSPSFGAWFATELEQGDQIYMPPGVAHGFLVTGETADLHYRVTQEYRPEYEAGIRWDDPDLGISWPCKDVIVSERDAAFPFLVAVPPNRLPVFSG